MVTKITPEIVRELLDYNPETGIFTWKERAREWFKSHRGFKSWNAKYPGKRAGCVLAHHSGYQCRQIYLFGCRHYEHHLAWIFMTDDPLPQQIDHRNRNATCNRWLNLRASTNAKNGQNRSKSRRNTSGITGVCWDKDRGKWKAMCRVNGKLRNIGRFDEIDDATQAITAFRDAHGFDPKHGLEIAHYRKAAGSQGELACR